MSSGGVKPRHPWLFRFTPVILVVTRAENNGRKLYCYMACDLEIKTDFCKPQIRIALITFYKHLRCYHLCRF